MDKKVELHKLKEIICVVAKSNQIKINPMALNTFLLGGQLQCTEETKQDIISGKRTLSRENKSIIFHKGTWKKEYFRNKVLQNGEASLLEKELRKEFTEVEKEKSFEDMMKAMVYQAVFGTQMPLIFPEFRKTTCANYVRWREKEQEIETILEESNIIILEGGAGIGKTQLVKSFIQNMKMAGKGYDDISWNEIMDVTEMSVQIESIEERLKRITEFDEVPTKQQNQANEDKIRRLQEQSEDTLLILECPILTEKDSEFLLNYFGQKKIRIIVTTRKCPENVKIPIIYCLKLPKKILIKIFEANLDVGKKYTDYFTDKEFEQLLENIENNTLVLKLLAKMIKNKEFLFSNKKEDLLDINKWGRCKDSFPKVNENAYTGMKSSNNPVYYLYLFLYKYGIKPYDLEDAYAEMALWAKDGIPIKKLREWMKRGAAEKIEEAIDKGILEYEEDDIVRMPRIIADAIWIKHPIAYKDYRIEIENFVKLLQFKEKWEYSYQILYKIMWNLIFRFSFSIYKEASDKRRKEWWNTVSGIIETFVYMGNANSAKRIFKMMEDELSLSLEKVPLVQKNQRLLEEQKNCIHIVLVKIRLMTGERILDCLIEEKKLMEENPVFCYKMCVELLKWVDRIVEVECINFEKLKCGWLEEEINVLEQLIELFKISNVHLEQEVRCSEMSEIALYFMGVCSFLKSYLVEGRAKQEYKKEGYEILKKCEAQSVRVENTQWLLQCKLKLIFLMLIEALMTGSEWNVIEFEMKEIGKYLEVSILPWEQSLLYSKVLVIYSIYSSRKNKSPNVILKRIQDFGNMAEEQIDSFTEEERRKIEDVVKGANDAIEKLYIEQCQKISHINN